MSKRGGPVHVVTTKRQYKGQEYSTHLLRRSYREDGKVKNETLGNLSHLPDNLIDMIRRSLRGEAFVAASERFEIASSRIHGDSDAVLLAMRKLGIASILSSRPCREARLVMAMIAARIIAADTKLATTRWWHSRTLVDELDVADANEDDLYAAMDWLVERQDRIQRKLAGRHLKEGGMLLYDLSSSWYEGETCVLARRGYSRDGRKGTLQINYGLMTDENGCPVAVSVHPGNTSDSVTFMPEVARAREDFGISQIVVVGDRGMISQKVIDQLADEEGVDWITALRSTSIRKLIDNEVIQPDLFDERDIVEFTHDDYPGERLVVCRNPALATKRDHKRQDMLQATEVLLAGLAERVAKGRLSGADEIGIAVGKVINRHNMAKHFLLDITEDSFTFSRDADKIATEAVLDGLYVIRTSLPKDRMDRDDCVRTYKRLAQVERAFRTFKSVDLRVRPIHHRVEHRVRAHIFLCMLSYYVEFHMREAWRELIFADEDQEAKLTRDPVAPAKRSQAAMDKVSSRTFEDGSPVHSFRTVLSTLSTVVRNTCQLPGNCDPDACFDMITTPNNVQRRARDLIDAIAV